MYFLLSLLSAVALLAYGVSVTKSAMLRACGASLGQFVNRALNSRLRQAAVGLGITMLVQSSTATSLLVSSFLQQGVLSLGTALAIMLGADLGTAVMARILTLDLTMLCPLFMTLGTALYLISKERPQFRNTGGIILGLGLILLALELIVKATQPVITSDLTALLLTSLAGELTFSVLLGLLLAVICYSSLAAVLLTSLLSASGSISPECALAVVLGSNLGSCVLEILGALRQGPVARRVMLGNTIFKTALAVVCLPLLPYIVLCQEDLCDLSQFVIWFHVAFNALVCASMLGLVDPCSKLLVWMIPERELPPDPGAPKHLDRNAFMDPALALGNATREVLSVGDFLRQMLQDAEGRISLRDNPSSEDADLYHRIRGLSQEITDYLSCITCDTGKQRLRLRQCILASLGLGEGAKLVRSIDRGLTRINAGSAATFAPQRREELLRISHCCARTLELALAVFLNGGKKMMRSYQASRDELFRLTSSYGGSGVLARSYAEGRVDKEPRAEKENRGGKAEKQEKGDKQGKNDKPEKPVKADKTDAGDRQTEVRYNVEMLALLEYYRQLGGVFDQALQVARMSAEDATPAA